MTFTFRRRRLCVLAIAALGAAAIAGCGSSSSGSNGSGNGDSPSAASAKTLTIGLQSQQLAVPALLAQRWGLLKPYGISNVELKSFTELPAMFAAVQNGQIPVAIQTLSGLVAFDNATKGTKLLLLGAGPDNFFSFIARKGSGIPPAGAANDWQATVRALKGKKVGVAALGGIQDLFVQYMAQQAGLSPSAFSIVPVGVTATSAAALQHGIVDVAVGEQLTSTLLKQYGTDVLDFGAGQGPATLTNPTLLTGGVSITSAATFKSEKGMISGFAKAYKQAKALMTEPSRKADVIDVLEQLGFTPSVATAVYPEIITNRQEVTPESYAQTIAALRTTGVIKGAAPSYGTIVANVG